MRQLWDKTLLFLLFSFKLFSFPQEFHVRQEPGSRLFHVFEEGRSLGAVANSDYGQFDFYDSAKERKWINRFDALHDRNGHRVARIQFVDSGMEVHSEEKGLLFKVEKESEVCFVFRDAEDVVLAVAIWSWVPTGEYFLWLFNTYVRDWSVMIVDRQRLEEIPLVFLVWPLLKHSQEFFPGPTELPYCKGVASCE